MRPGVTEAPGTPVGSAGLPGRFGSFRDAGRFRRTGPVSSGSPGLSGIGLSGERDQSLKTRTNGSSVCSSPRTRSSKSATWEAGGALMADFTPQPE